MKQLGALTLLLASIFLVGCEGNKDASVVVDTDEAAAFNVPEGEMEKQMAAAAEASKKGGN